MIIIEREMKVTESTTTHNDCWCQASFNSNGNITLRNYDNCDKEKDEIIILSQQETRAIFNLIKELKRHDMLPF